MNWLAGAWREFIGLFVDDLGFALVILACLAVAGVLFRLGLVPMEWRGPLLFVALGAILLENTLRRARR